jgi:hypothetical protein
MMNLRTTVFAGALALTSLSVNALDIRDIHLGDAWDTKVLKAKLHTKDDPSGNPYFPRVTCDQHSCSGFVSINGGYPVKLTVREMDKKVSYVDINLDGRDYVDGTFEEALQILVTKFGKPAFDKSPVVQNAFGAQYVNREAEWQDKGDVLVIQKYNKTLEKGLIQLWAPRYQVVTAAPKPNL